MTWRWAEAGIVVSDSGCRFRTDALPMIPGRGGPQELAPYVADSKIFQNERIAFEYLVHLARQDLEYRGFREERVSCFGLKQEASHLLHRRIATCSDAAELAMLQAMWNEVHRPKYRSFVWSEKQKESLERIRGNVCFDDEDAKHHSCRFLYIAGAPGSGKSAILLEALT